MPVSRLISDLDLIITELNESSPAAPTVTDDLRLITARFNELQRQLDIAQLKLTSVTSMVELNTVEPQVDISPEPQVCNLRFKIPDNFSTNTPEIDEAHIAMFNVGNNLYCLVLQRTVDMVEAEIALTELINCTKVAFTIEEQMMAATRYSQLESHSAIHLRMFNYLLEMRELVKFQPLAIAVKLDNFFGSWFPWHLQHNDNNFSHFLMHEYRPLVLSLEHDMAYESPNDLDEKIDNDVILLPKTQNIEHPPQPQPLLRLEHYISLTRKMAEQKTLTEQWLINYPPEVITQEPAYESQKKTNTIVNALRIFFRDLTASLILNWKEKRHVARSSLGILKHYKTISKSNPDLSNHEVYLLVVMAYSGCDSAMASTILINADASFAAWPVTRDLNLQDIAHYLTVMEYYDLYGRDFGMSYEVDKLITDYIPYNL